MSDDGATQAPEQQNPEDICPRTGGISGGRHAFIWMAGDSNVVYCMNCGQKRKRTMTEDTVIEQSLPLDQEVPALTDDQLFTAPKEPAEQTTIVALKEQIVQAEQENEALAKTVPVAPQPAPQEMAATGGMPAYTSQVDASPPADPPAAAPAPSGGE